MGIFSTIKNAIFGKDEDDKKPAAPAAGVVPQLHPDQRPGEGEGHPER